MVTIKRYATINAKQKAKENQESGQSPYIMEPLSSRLHGVFKSEESQMDEVLEDVVPLV